MAEPTPREVWRAAWQRFTEAPRGTPWVELVRLAGLEKEAWRALMRAERESANKQGEGHDQQPEP